jgi:hypothetical protein
MESPQATERRAITRPKFCAERNLPIRSGFVKGLRMTASKRHADTDIEGDFLWIGLRPDLKEGLSEAWRREITKRSARKKGCGSKSRGWREVENRRELHRALGT